MYTYQNGFYICEGQILSIAKYFKVMGYTKNLPIALYNINEIVVYNGSVERLKGKKYVVAGMNIVDYIYNGGDILIEYALYGFPYAVWEDELLKVEKEVSCETNSECKYPIVKYSP